MNSNSSRSLSDSPWFWAALFAIAALGGLWAIQNKHVARQTRLERMDQTRVRVMIEKSGGEAPVLAPPESTP